jgi:protein-disulfide isomerase
MRRYLPFIIIAAVLLLGGGGGALLFRWKRASVPVLKDAPGHPGAEPAHIRGGSRARVTLEEFGDYQCPPCAGLSKTLDKVEHDYGARLRVVFRNYPLRMHKHAMIAARAAEAAGLQGRFWEMHDLLFQNSQHWPAGSDARATLGPAAPTPAPQSIVIAAEPQVRAVFESYAATLKLDVERFKKDMESEQVKARIEQDQSRAAALGVDRTPIVFLNGRQLLTAWRTPQELSQAIDAELSGKASSTTTPTVTPTSAK